MAVVAQESWKYLTISPSDENWGLVCTTVGYQNVTPQSQYPLSKHPDHYQKISSGRILEEYQLVYIISGSGSFESQSCPKTTISEGTIIMLFPGEWHIYSPDKETGWSELWVGFRGMAADNIVSNGFFSPDEPLHRIGISETIISTYHSIIDLATRQKSGYQQVICGSVSYILGLLRYKMQNRTYADNHVIDKLNKARMIMNENLSNNLSAEDIALRLGLGYTWFRRMFKKYTGTSPAKYQSQLKLAKAKELLVSSHLTVSEIAYELGFDSISQFSTFFKTNEGITASEFRDKNALTYR